MAINELTEYLKIAFEHKNNGEYKKAIDYFYKALTIDSESTEIMLELAFLYTELYQPERAISLYEQIITRCSDNDYAKYMLAELLKKQNSLPKAKKVFIELYNKGYEPNKTTEQLFEILISEEDYDEIINLYNQNSNKITSSLTLYYVAYSYAKLKKETLAEEYYEKSLKYDSKNISAGLEIVSKLFHNQKFDETEQLIFKMLKYQENDYLYYILAEIYYQKEDTDSAIKYYSYAIKTNPNISEYYYKIAILFSTKGFYKEAEEAFNTAIEIEPDNILYNYSLAYMYYTNRDYDKAEKIIDYILELAPKNIQATSLKIIIYSIKEQSAKASELVENFIPAENNDDFAYYALAIYYESISQYKNAIENINKAIEINNESIEYKYLSAKYNFIIKNSKEAECICKQILEKNNKYIQAYILLTQVYIQENKNKEAINNINKILELDKNIYEAYYMLANINYTANNLEIALENYKIAISINPNEEKIYLNIAECYYKLGNYKEAYIYYKEAADFDVTNAYYRYSMAKCAIEENEDENAISNFIMMKRLAPYNIEYTRTYTDYLYKQGKKKEAIKILNSLSKRLNRNDKVIIKNLIKSYL